MVAKMFLVCIWMFLCLVFLSSVHAHPLTKGYLDEMPEGCKGQDYCFKNDTYPADHIEHLLTEINLIDSSLVHAFVHRDSDSEGYQNPCDIFSSFDKIYEIVDTEGKVRFVVQSEKWYQIHQLKICKRPDESLADPKWPFTSEMVRNNIITCNQTYNQVEFVVLNLAGNGFEQVTIRNGLPVACVCKTQKKNRYRSWKKN